MTLRIKGEPLFATATLKLNDSPDSGGPSSFDVQSKVKKGLEKVHLKKNRLLAVFMHITPHTCACMAVCCSTRRLLLS